MRKLIFIVAAAFCLLALPADGYCRGMSICQAASSDDYVTKLSGQFIRGASNLVFCWLELFNQPYRAAKNNTGVIKGVGRGVRETIARGFSGAGEILTAPTHRCKDGTYLHLIDSCPYGLLGLEER
jgi:hypothetical protein